MKRRYAIVGAVVALAVVGVGTAILVTPSAETASSPATSDELEGSFTVSERITVDGTRFVERTTVVDERAGTQRQQISFENGSTDNYWDPSGNQYARLSAASERELDDSLEDTPGAVLERSAADHTAVVALDEEAGVREPIESRYPDPLIADIFANIAYADVGTIEANGTHTAESATVYEPREGWTDGPSRLRYVRHADGELHVGEADRLYYANVSLEAIDAETRLEYLLEHDERETLTMTYELERDTEGSAPDWLPENATVSDQ
ncbi:hypothetical protein [Natrarchaeobaculum sulfurireducens]|uniref:Uncharacterized protein n=1 Tax=Natrarchaeobaculum sulfurireducens TaxID=2044521 RepID=A0A346PCC1_9EURY|nr:hypothetical protein [Natrarchaeobaculum sulfurireducens]AXR77166.1 hypothetical protein AArc1_0824 [Natrarchaeobaculum sulfurireducens]